MSVKVGRMLNSLKPEEPPKTVMEYCPPVVRAWGSVIGIVTVSTDWEVAEDQWGGFSLSPRVCVVCVCGVVCGVVCVCVCVCVVGLG